MHPGVLLPCVASALLIALNDAALMGQGTGGQGTGGRGAGGQRGGSSKPQSALLNALMFPCVTIALYFASFALLKQTVGRWDGFGGTDAAIIAAVPISAIGAVALGGVVWRVRSGGAEQQHARASASKSAWLRAHQSDGRGVTCGLPAEVALASTTSTHL